MEGAPNGREETIMSGQLTRVRTMLRKISAELEPNGGAVETEGATSEELTAFIREAAAVTWALGMSTEGAAGSIRNPVPR